AGIGQPNGGLSLETNRERKGISAAMANDFITPQLVARTVLATLYNQTVLLPLVWRDFDADFAGKQGATVNVRKPAVFEAQDFNRATGIVIQDADEDSVPITLDHLIDVSFAVGAE